MSHGYIPAYGPFAETTKAGEVEKAGYYFRDTRTDPRFLYRRAV